jgi:NTE family protein
LTWGVLDALLEDGKWCLDGISGTSAGAMNAMAVAHGFAQAALQHTDAQDAHAAGCAQARKTLARFWEGVGTLGSLMWGVPTGNANPWAAVMAQWFSPYQTNPLGINPLRSLLEREIDFSAIAAVQKGKGKAPLSAMPKVFVCATNVRTGRGEIFSGSRLSADAVMASACLPLVFKAVEIKGDYYWDGGYSGNPALYPLIYQTNACDILLVQINPIEHTDLPDTAAEIMDRINEVTFNASLLGELRAIDFVRRLLAQGKLDPGRYKSVRMHRIDGGAALHGYGPDTKMRADIVQLTTLFARGRDAARQWMSDHRADVGVQSTLHLGENRS